MPSTDAPATTEQVVAVPAVVDAEQVQRAAESNAALILMACLVALVGGTQLLVALLGRLS